MLASFFGIESEKIAAEKTKVTVSPQSREVQIVQESLFAFIQSENDSLLVLEEWDKLLHQKDRDIAWSEILDDFPVKNLNLTTDKNSIQPHLQLRYTDVKDLLVLEVGYDPKSNQFSIENSPDYNITTNNGNLIDNHWIFDGDSTFSFIIQPFLEIPEEYQQFKRPLRELVEWK